MDMTTQIAPPHRENFYISYHEDDKKWAKWIEWSLNDIGYSTSLLKWGIQFGRNIQDEKDAAIQNATYIIVVLSPRYLKAFQAVSGWVEVFGKDRLLPVVVQDCDVQRLFRPHDYINLVGADVNERKAYDMLSEGIESWGIRHSDTFSLPRHDQDRSEHLLYFKPAYPGGAVVQLANATSVGVSGLASWESQDTYEEPDDDKYNPIEYEGLVIDSTILERKGIVDDIYGKLVSPDTTAVSLTGIGGVGKSMLASLVYRKVDECRKSNQGPFAAKPVWLEINEEVTLIDLAGNLFKAIDKPFHDFRKHSPRYQAKLLLEALKGADKPVLIILDPFEKILDLQTGHLQIDRQEIAEWLDVLKSQFCPCKVLLTSRLQPVGNRSNPGATFLKQHPIPGLSEEEAIELLSNLGVKEPEETKEDLITAIARCDNHPYALYLLAQVLKDKKSSLKLLLQDQKLWDDDVAKNLLNHIYMNQLNPEQRMVLLAFSIYRKDVPLEAAEAILSDELRSGRLKSVEMRNAFDVLLKQHLLQAIEGGRCRLHAIVKSYAHNHFDDSSDQANEQAKRAAHAKAASYYYKKHEQGGDTSDMVEAIWHYCQAGQWQTAYTFLSPGNRYYDQIKHWGGNSTLLQLYKLLIPLKNWLPLPKEIYTAAKIYSILGDLYNALGQKASALDRYKDALHHFKQKGEDGEEAAILKKLGPIYEDLGDIEQARQCYEQALAIFKRAGEREEEGKILSSLGRVLRKQGKKVEARQYLEQALAIFKASGEHLHTGQMLKLLGEISYEMGMNGDAQQHFDEALIIFGQEKDRAGEGETSTIWVYYTWRQAG